MDNHIEELEKNIDICHFCSEESFSKSCFRCAKEVNEKINFFMDQILEQVGPQEFETFQFLYLITISAQVTAEMFSKNAYRRKGTDGTSKKKDETQES